MQEEQDYGDLDAFEKSNEMTDAIKSQILNAVENELRKNPNLKNLKIDMKSFINFNSEDKKKMSIKGSFVLAFIDNLAELSLNNSEFRILMYICKIMEYGNLVNLSQKSVSDALKLDKSKVSRAFKSLEEKDILVKKDGHLFVNSNICCKGLAHKMTEEKRNNLISSRKENDTIKNMYQ